MKPTAESTAPADAELTQRTSLALIAAVVVACIGVSLLCSHILQRVPTTASLQPPASVRVLDSQTGIPSPQSLTSPPTTYLIFDWTTFCAAAFTAVLAFMWVRTYRSEGTPVIAAVLLGACTLDAALTLAVDHMLQSSRDCGALAMSGWVITRTLNALFLLGGAAFVLKRGSIATRDTALRWVGIASLALGACACLVLIDGTLVEAISRHLTADGFLKRPYDLIPLSLYIFGAGYLFPRMLQHDRSPLAFAILLSMIPSVASQALVVFGSRSPFDTQAHVAVALKALAYCIPLWGLLSLYFKSHRRELAAKHELDLGKEERRRVEQQSALLTKALESAANGVMITDRTGVITWVNHAFSLLSGYTKAEAVGKHARMLKSDKHGQDFYTSMMDTIHQGKTWHGEIVNKRKDGSLYTEEMTLTPVTGDNDTITHFIAIKQDVTSRIESERALIESSSRLTKLAEEQKFLLDNMNDFVYRHDSHRIFHYLSPTVERVTGYSPAEWIVRYTTIMKNKPQGDASSATVAALAHDNESHTPYVMEIQHKDGHLITLEFNESPYWANGKVAGIIGVARDVTDRESANKAMLQSEQKYRRLFQDSADALLLLDEKEVFIDCNEAAIRMLRYETKDDILGKHITDLSPPLQTNGLESVELVARYVEIVEEKGSHRFEWDHIRANGEVFPVEVLLTALPVGDHRVLHVVWRDITDRKRDAKRVKEYAASLETANSALTGANEALQQVNAELVRKNEELDEFTYVASHDLQEPLRKLVSFGELLRKDAGENLPDRAKTDLDFISDAARRMQTLVKDLLRLSRAGRSAMRMEAVQLNTCVDAAIEALSTRISEVDAEIVQAHLPTVLGDSTLLTQLFQNLISNALKFIPKEKRPVVRITSERTENEWIIGVLDNGIGIKKEYCEQIFAPFKRLHGRAEYAGSGIGLAICRKAVERHGGRIWVESKVDEGSHFQFSMKDSSETETWENSQQNESSSSSQKMTAATRN